MLSMSFYGVYFARVNRGYQGAMAPRILPIFAIGAIPLAVWAVAGLSAGEAASWSAVALLALLGVVVYVPAYVLQHRLILTAGPSYAALLGLAVPPLVGATSAGLHLADLPGTAQLIGTALTLLGMALVLRRPRGLSASGA
jgi:drug/metabolite transporter (DMT)-like permease